MGGRSLEVLMFFFIFFVVVVFSGLEASEDQCEESSCSHHGPTVRFPFWLNGYQSHHCGYPGFELSCTDRKETVMELPFSGKFFVQSIDYKSRLVDVRDPNGCIFRRLLHFNLSASPFQQSPRLYDHHPDDSPRPSITPCALFNCSSTISVPPDNAYDYSHEKGTLINCLSISGYPIYAFSDYGLFDALLYLQSCSSVTTISLSYLWEYDVRDSDVIKKYESDPNLGILLNWSVPVCRDCEARGKMCRLKNHTSGPKTECYDFPNPPVKPPVCRDCEARGKMCRLKNHTSGPKTECYDFPNPPGATTKLVVTGVTGGFFLFVIVIVASIRFYHAHNSNKIEKENQIRVEKFLEDYKSLKPTRYSYADIKRFTNQFKEKLGEGGYGSVFKGKLSSEIPIAVKILNNSKGNGDEFINEVSTMGRIHHVNVVRLVGFCADGFRRALVYEFLPNESLEKFIFSRNSKNPFLGWEKLQDIAIGIATGLEYLHQGCNQRILHFDIKPHNILLDHNFSPKISDFGLAKLCSKDESVVSMTAARGTKGYIAPEVLSRNFGNVSHKSDVYSFGILLLEMVGGRKNIDAREENTDQGYIPEWIHNYLDQGEDLEIREDDGSGTFISKKLTIVALWCIQWYPVDRPSMGVVVQMLEGDTESLIIPPNPFSATTPTKTSVANAKIPFHTKLTVISEQG